VKDVLHQRCSNAVVIPASLIVCSRNRPDTLKRTVDSVLAGDSLPSEIVIIDQSDAVNSDLNCHPSLPGCTIRYEWVSFRGVSRGRNAGVRLARYDVLAFIDDDMEVTSVWFTRMMEALQAAKFDAVVTGSVLADPSTMPGHFASSIKEDTRPHIYRGRVNDDVLYTGNMAAHTATIQAVSGFDERLGPGSRFPAAEDNDLGFRLLEGGCTIVYAPEAKLYHLGWRPHHHYLRVRWLYGRGQGAFYAKHLGSASLYMLRRIFTDVLRRTARSVFRVWRSPRLALGDLVFVSALISGTVTWVVTETRSVDHNATGHLAAN
jgi:glycosyltransferase involved in cell wall biosynthesis